MTPEKQKRLEACLQELSTIVYQEANPRELTNKSRKHRKNRANSDIRTRQPPCCPFFIEQATGTKTGKPRTVKSCVGILKLKAKQADKLGLKPRSQLSPLLEKCCLRLSANQSYQSAAVEIEALTGVKVSHSTQHRLVLQQDLPLPQALQAVSEVSVDGGKVRWQTRKDGSHWRDYKAVRLQGIYYAAFYQDNQSLIDYVNTQPLTNPLVCLGDGHDGVWNLIAEFATKQSRWEILDWYHRTRKSLQAGRVVKAVKAS